MAVFRVNKTQDYTVMSNHHFRNKEMSLKAKGLLSLMLSLPDNWDYSLNGLVAICKENESAIKTTLQELKDLGYLEIVKKYPQTTDTGRIEYDYLVYENPKQEGKKQGLENLPLEILSVENQPQLNTNILNTNNIYFSFIKKIKDKKIELEKSNSKFGAVVLANAWAKEQPEYLQLTNEEQRKLFLEV